MTICGSAWSFARIVLADVGVGSLDQDVVDGRCRTPLDDVHRRDVAAGLADRARQRAEGAGPIRNADPQ